MACAHNVVHGILPGLDKTPNVTWINMAAAVVDTVRHHGGKTPRALHTNDKKTSLLGSWGKLRP